MGRRKVILLNVSQDTVLLLLATNRLLMIIAHGGQNKTVIFVSRAISMSQLLTIKDKTFKPFISYAKINATVKSLAVRMNTELAGQNPLFLAVLNGSFMFAADLIRELKMDCGISFVKLASYEGTESSGEVEELIGLVERVDRRTVVIIEDIVDSGRTVKKLKEILRAKKAGALRVVTLLYKPEAHHGDDIPDYVGFNIGNEFVVGYGLDYDGAGRNLKDIYVLA